MGWERRSGGGEEALGSCLCRGVLLQRFCADGLSVHQQHVVTPVGNAEGCASGGGQRQRAGGGGGSSSSIRSTSESVQISTGLVVQSKSTAHGRHTSTRTSGRGREGRAESGGDGLVVLVVLDGLVANRSAHSDRVRPPGHALQN